MRLYIIYLKNHGAFQFVCVCGMAIARYPPFLSFKNRNLHRIVEKISTLFVLYSICGFLISLVLV